MVDTGTVVVDVSCVVRSADLGDETSLDRLDLVLSCWHQQLDAFAEVTLVADRSLKHHLPDHEQRGLRRRLGEWGEYQLVAFADPVILQTAAERDAAIIT